MEIQKIRKVSVPIYVIILLLSFFIIRTVLREEEIDVDSKDEEKQVMEVKPVVVHFVVETYPMKEYRVRLKNEDKVIDLLSYLREKEDFFYEKVDYVDHTVIDLVMNKPTPTGSAWRIFVDDRDVTDILKDEGLEDEKTYTLKLIRE